MLFLLNDVVLTIDPREAVPPLDAGKFSNLSLNKLSALGAELFTGDPGLARNKPERARRLASLIVMKSPEINAALFVAPTKGCRPEQVACRFATRTSPWASHLTSSSQSMGVLSVIRDGHPRIGASGHPGFRLSGM